MGPHIPTDQEDEMTTNEMITRMREREREREEEKRRTCVCVAHVMLRTAFR